MSQYSIETDQFLNINKTIYEVMMLADPVDGSLNSDYHRAFVDAGYYTPKGRLQTSQSQITYFSTNIYGLGLDFWIIILQIMQRLFILQMLLQLLCQLLILRVQKQLDKPNK